MRRLLDFSSAGVKCAWDKNRYFPDPPRRPPPIPSPRKRKKNAEEDDTIFCCGLCEEGAGRNKTSVKASSSALDCCYTPPLLPSTQYSNTQERRKENERTKKRTHTYVYMCDLLCSKAPLFRGLQESVCAINTAAEMRTYVGKSKPCSRARA